MRRPSPSIFHSQVPDRVQPGVRLAPPSESAEAPSLMGAASISRALAVVSGSMEADTTPASGKPSPPFESSAPMTAAPCCVSDESVGASDESSAADDSPCPPCVAVTAESTSALRAPPPPGKCRCRHETHHQHHRQKSIYDLPRSRRPSLHTHLYLIAFLLIWIAVYTRHGCFGGKVCPGV